MKQEDKAAFDELFSEYVGHSHTSDNERHCARYFFKAGMAHRDAQLAGATVLPSDQQLFEIAKRVIPAVEKALGLQQAPAVAVNEQMLEALKGWVWARENGASEELAEQYAKAAIATAEAQRKGVV